jgi:hypothetical protein
MNQFARRALELAVGWAFTHDAGLRLPCQDDPSALIHEPSFRQAGGEAVFSKARAVPRRLHVQDGVRTEPDRRLLEHGQGAAHRDLGGHGEPARIRHPHRGSPDGARRDGGVRATAVAA